MSNIIGIRNNNTIISYQGATKRTKQVTLTITGTNWTTSSAVGVAHADSLGVWRLEFNGVGTFSSATNAPSLTISGVTFSSTIQAITLYDNQVGNRTTTYARTNASASTFQASLSDTSNNIFFSGDVELASEPTWAAANMEGVVAADVYIAPASASASGLVDTSAQSFAGVKDFTNGIKLSSGSDILSDYDIGTFSITLTGPFTAPLSLPVKYVKVGKMVTVSITSTTDACNTSAAIVAAAGQWPAALRPVGLPEVWTLPTYNNSGYPAETGSFILGTDGSVTMYLKRDGTPWTGSGNGGVLSHTASYVIVS